MHSVEPCCPEVPPEEAEEENTAVWEGSPIHTVGYCRLFHNFQGKGKEPGQPVYPYQHACQHKEGQDFKEVP
ncbi:hypothetical protein DU52_08555 [Methanosarcina mazei]|uniref:Uncharacterized protein n=1 Tax=Methanosarcina mazei TaxID=2209 RepID=A0A0F8G4W8_METMZ|nr:hypothetical protein [Methanosarcina mazei]KKG32585.1 hypothetical protein DU52_08555 [Methanosarcina mazei]KKG37718.1 hypothetical protein DU30_11705 [Methanosarcina mazei]KKG59511.1 hypothetical protein DU67_09845 [Methanosarcina mazei]KKG70106.1 hypothetical protein DU43_11440 [Methanosarcina mazei]KKH22797.1 hypothetical protein DU58_08405 [Methanosarcina mazei]